MVLKLLGIPFFNSNRGKIAGFFSLHTTQLIMEIAISETGMITTTAASKANKNCFEVA